MSTRLDGQPVLMVHPADVDLPAVKALAAELGWDVVASPVVPSGQAFTMPRGTLRIEGD